MLAHLATSGRFATGRTVPRTTALAVIRQASSGGHNKKEESAAVSSPAGHSGGSDSSPMSQRPLPPDDGKVRT